MNRREKELMLEELKRWVDELRGKRERDPMTEEAVARDSKTKMADF